MSERIKEFFVKASTEGLYLPVAQDAGKPSVTLFFMYLSNLVAIVSLILLHVKGDPFTATSTTAIYAIIQTVLYMLRRLQKAKFDLDDKSIELEGEDDETSEVSN